MKQDRTWGWLEGTLWLLASLCLIAAATQMLQAREAHNEMVAQEVPVKSPLAPGKESHVLGRLEISKVGLAVPIVDDYDAQKLVRGVGHVPGSALPGGLGNLVLAGHRDTFFRPLRNVRAGMEIDVTTPDGRYRYKIDRTEIVTPDHVEILDIGEQPEMTLITCYPFDFIGSAPQRFIVHAHLLSVEAA